ELHGERKGAKPQQALEIGRKLRVVEGGRRGLVQGGHEVILHRMVVFSADIVPSPGAVQGAPVLRRVAAAHGRKSRAAARDARGSRRGRRRSARGLCPKSGAARG